MSVRLLAACSAVVLVAACATMQKERFPPRAPPVAEAPPPLRAPPPKLKPEVGTFGFNVDGMDVSVVPGVDFFRYAVGKWVDTTEIPPDRSSLGSVAVIREKAIAKAHVSVAETNDVAKGNTVWLRSELAKEAAGLDWTAFLTAAGMNDQPRFGAWQPSAIAGISKLTVSQHLQAWKDYLVFHTIENGAPSSPRRSSTSTPQTGNALFVPPLYDPDKHVGTSSRL
jgi:Peptidase family M13